MCSRLLILRWLLLEKMSFMEAVEVSQELKKSAFGAHFLVIYPDLSTLREMYSHYVKFALSEEGNEIVLVLPFLETVDNVRRILSENSANIDVRNTKRNNHF
jgi:hypothetical protein